MLAADVFRFQHATSDRLLMQTKTAGLQYSANNAFPNNEWQFLALTYRASDNRVEAYIQPAGASLGPLSSYPSQPPPSHTLTHGSRARSRAGRRHRHWAAGAVPRRRKDAPAGEWDPLY